MYLRFSYSPRLGSAWHHAGEVAKAGKCLHQARDMYKVVPGEDFPLYKTLLTDK